MARKLFLNLAVRDLSKTMAFWKGLGFDFNPKFTDDKAACMVLSDEAYVMLLSEPFFKSFTKKQLCDTKTHLEGLFAMSADNRAAVDSLVEQAVKAGAVPAGETQDHGFMYLRSFSDLDGHTWEIFWMDPAQAG
jgi:predicted lactoylglutathione lyase